MAAPGRRTARRRDVDPLEEPKGLTRGTRRQRTSAKIVAIHVHQVEGVEDQALRLLANRAAERMEVRPAMLVLHDDLAVYDGGCAVDVRQIRLEKAGDLSRAALGRVEIAHPQRVARHR